MHVSTRSGWFGSRRDSTSVEVSDNGHAYSAKIEGTIVAKTQV